MKKILIVSMLMMFASSAFAVWCGNGQGSAGMWECFDGYSCGSVRNTCDKDAQLTTDPAGAITTGTTTSQPKSIRGVSGGHTGSSERVKVKVKVKGDKVKIKIKG